METVVSPKYKLNKHDLKSLAIGLAVALAGAAITYLTEVVAKIDFGDWTPIVVTLNSVVANAVRKWISENYYVRD